MDDTLGRDESGILQDMFRALNQRLAKYGLQAKSGPLPDFVNKTLLKHSPRHLYLYSLWLLLHYDGQAVVTEIIMVPKA